MTSTRLTQWLIAVIAAIVGMVVSVSAQRGGNERGASCQPAATPKRLPGIPEASGIAVARRTPGVLWSIRDSGEPVLFALNDSGAATAQVRVTGADVDDWEDVSVAACPAGSCVFIADIGDNNASRPHISIYRVREPAPGDKMTAPADVLHARYPDRPQDAEGFFLIADRMFVVTKGSTGPIRLYRFPAGFTPGATVRLEPVGDLPVATSKGDKARITDADASADGRWVAMRLPDAVAFYHGSDLLKGPAREIFRVDLTALREPQGEGVTIGADGAVYLVGEGPAATGGTFAKMRCSLD